MVFCKVLLQNRFFCVSYHTSYLSRTQGRCPWRKNLSCGEISNFCTWQMKRNLKFLHMWINFTFHHMTDVEKSEISFIMCTIYGILLHFMLFCCKKLIFFAIYAVFRKISLLQFTRYCVEKILAQISDRGEKMTNMRYDISWLFLKGNRINFLPKNDPFKHLLKWKIFCFIKVNHMVCVIMQTSAKRRTLYPDQIV